MTQTVAIPGRRVTAGETFYTEWVPRGGDCFIVRAEGLHDGSGGATLEITAWTKSEEGTGTGTQVPAAVSDITLASGINTAVYLITADGDGASELVRLKIVCTGDSGTYWVLRIFPIIFFDGAKAAY